MKFIDSTEIHVNSGRGGDGLCSFRRARNMPKLGPDGGNGGKGGDVVLRAHAQLNTLSHIRYRQHFKASPGGKGGTNDKTGRTGKSITIELPLGTEVYNRESGEKITDVTERNDSFVVAKGGRGGLGNTVFTTSTRQAPQFATHGKEGENLSLKFELKVLADIGLAGFPNAGKSTLLSVISSAKPKIADYPFTTLTPQLGVVEVSQTDRHFGSFTVADIPGLIEGAAEGRGLGHDFLKHLERTKIVIYTIDASEEDPQEILAKLEKLMKELAKFGNELSQKRFFVALSKVDLLLPEQKQALEKVIEKIKEKKCEVFLISAAEKQGLKELIYHCQKQLIEIDTENKSNTELDFYKGNIV